MIIRDRPRRIITRAVYDMTRDGIPVIEQDSYLYHGPMALCDAADDKLRTAIEAALGKHASTVSEVVRKAQEDITQFREVQNSTKDAIAKLNTDGQKLYADMLAEKAKQDARLLDLEQRVIKGLPMGGGRVKTIGEQYTDSPEWKEFSEKARSMPKVTSAPFKVKDITTTTGGSGVIPEYLPTPIIPAFQPLSIRNLLDVGTTESNLIEWVRELVYTNAAAVAPEGTLKPQSDITYQRLNVPVTTLAHFIRASKQILADFKQLQTLINGRLTFGLKLVEEKQILYGDGTGENLQGLIPQATPYNTALTNLAGFDTRLDIIRHAMLQVTLAFYPPTGIVMSPTDWHNLVLTKDSLHRYLLAMPGDNAPAMLWGLPVVQAFSMPPGDFLVGNFKLAATLFDREEAQILVSTEDQDNFIRNLVTVLCEERLALVVTRPQAFIAGTFPSTGYVE
jgi:HK97 family phage major capsid protein